MKWLVTPGSKPFKRLLLFIGISLGLLVAQFFIWSWVQSLAVQWKQDRSQEQQITELSRRLAAIKDRYAQQQGTFRQLSVLTPHAAQTPQLVSQLEKVAEASGVSEVTQTIDEGAAGNPQPLAVTLQAKGQAGALLNYLRAVEQLPELVDISTWSLNLNTAAPALAYSLDMTVVFFLQP